MNIVFFGSSDYCLPILETLLVSFNLTAVVTKPDQPIGRKQELLPTKVKLFSIKNHIPFFTPKDKISLSTLSGNLNDLNPDIFIVADYGLIIPKNIIELPKYKTLNIHFSKLPLLRGPSPVQYSILSGEESALISYMLMDEKMDTGMILSQTEEKLEGNETTDRLYRKLFNKASSELTDVINRYVSNELKPQKQKSIKATYTKLLKREDGFISWQLLFCAIKGKVPDGNLILNWSLSKYFSIKFCTLRFTQCFERALRALSPWPGIWTTVQIIDNDQQTTKRLKILKAHIESETVLILDIVQLEGKKPVSWKQFCQGYPIL